jgi:hypothetical protein
MNTKSLEFIAGKLWIKQGFERAGSMRDFLQTRFTAFKKPLFWLESAAQLNSDGSAGRLHDFHPFGERLPASLPVLEAAYVFGLQPQYDLPAGLHVIASGPGYRWFEFYTHQQEHCEEVTIDQRDYIVLTRRDFERFFGDAKPDWCGKRKLNVTEYWTKDGLLAWWLGDRP